MHIPSRISFWPIQLALAATFTTTAAKAVGITWTNSQCGNWNNALNWSPNQVPGSGDSATITTGHVTIDSMVSVGTLMVHSSLTVLPGGVLNLVGSGTKILDTVSSLTNYGTVNWQGGTLRVDGSSSSYGTVWNQPGGVFDIQCDEAIGYAPSYYYGLFNNGGLVRKSAGTGTNTISIYLNNTGTVQVQSGVIQMSGGGQVSGSYQADAGTAILFLSGYYSLSPNPTLSGEGIIRVISDVGMNGAFAGHLDWGSGTINANTGLTVLSNGILNLVGSGRKILNNVSSVTNYGTVNWQGGTLRVDGSSSSYGTVWNQPGGVFDIQCDGSLDYSPYPGQFNNGGLVRKSAGTGTNTISIYLNNTGTVDVASGRIRLTWNYAPGASSVLGFVLGGPTPGNLYGQFQVNGTATLAGTIGVWTTNGYTPAAGTIFTNLIAGTLNGSFVNSNVLAFESGQPFLCVRTNKMVLLQALPWDPQLVITIQPTNQTVVVGGNAIFNVQATGALPRSYQWRFNGGDLPADTNTTLTLSGVLTNAAGTYSVVITNAYGAVTSNPAILTVNLAAPFAIASSCTFTNGAFGFAFTNNPGASFTVLATTNLTQPLGDWITLTGLTEPFPGQFEFTDPGATNNPQRFYRVRSP
jgi:hypothetical protein